MAQTKGNLLVFSDFDSRLKWGLSMAHCLESEFEKIVVYHREDNFKQIQFYLERNYLLKYYKNRNEIFDDIDVFEKIQVIILAMGGTENIYFLHKLQKYFTVEHTRPIVVAGMNGLTDCNDLHALLCRVGADIICVNSYSNFIAFKKKMLALSIESDSLLLFGYMRNYEKVMQSRSRNCNQMTTLIVGQANMPSQRKQQRYFMNKIYAYAIKYPERKIIIKQRSIANKNHMNFYFERYKILQPWKWRIVFSIKMPKNVVFSDEPIEKLFLQADLCLGFHSTALIESINLGIPTLVIKDFGIGKNVGNHDFIESGLLASLDDWINDKIPRVNQKWKEENCNFATSDEVRQLKDLIKQKVFKQNKEAIKQYYSQERFPYFYQKIKFY